MAEDHDRDCEYCGRPIRMREVRRDEWLPFKRGRLFVRRRHYCHGYKRKIGGRGVSAGGTAAFALGTVVALLFLLALLPR